MRTIETNIYTFEELSSEAKQKALNNFEPFTDFIWQEAENTVDAFHNVFNTGTGSRSWLNVRTENIDENVLELKGSRLMAYLWNNYGNKLYKPKYIGSIDHEIRHKRTKVRDSKINESGKYSTYYSGCQWECNFSLTGVYYDDVILEPIIKAMHTPSTQTFQDLLTECFQNLRKSIEKEIEFRNSDEGKQEDIEGNEYEFTEDGRRF